MRTKTVPTFQIKKEEMLDVLKRNDILINDYARIFFEHSDFTTENLAHRINLVVCSLAELGLADGAVFADIILKADELGLGLCHVSAGVFFRLSYGGQPKSNDNTISGTHQSPDGAIIVMSEFLEQDDAFPKGLYLQNVDGQLWLRGYVCDRTYGWAADDVFAFEKYGK